MPGMIFQKKKKNVDSILHSTQWVLEKKETHIQMQNSWTRLTDFHKCCMLF